MKNHPVVGRIYFNKIKNVKDENKINSIKSPMHYGLLISYLLKARMIALVSFSVQLPVQAQEINYTKPSWWFA
jgi:hypothetical protein